MNIFLTGASGFLGRSISNELIKRKHIVIEPSHGRCDMLNLSDVMYHAMSAEEIIHCAADQGGIGEQNHSDKMYRNTVMGSNVIYAAKMREVKHVIIIGSVCEYPYKTELKEENLNGGLPVRETVGYSLSKRHVFNMANICLKSYCHPVLTNLYGPNQTSRHVVNDMVKKFVTAKRKDYRTVDLWGDPNTTRDHLFVEDAARMIIELQECKAQGPINVATGRETSMIELAEIIKKSVGFTGKIEFDKTKPVGDIRRKIDITKLTTLGIKHKVSLEEGIELTVKAYEEFNR